MRRRKSVRLSSSGAAKVAKGPPRDDRTSIGGVLRRYRGKRTVLFVALSVLDEHARALRAGTGCAGLTEKSIVKVFRELAKKYGHSDYHPTYIQRQLGPRGFLEVTADR